MEAAVSAALASIRAAPELAYAAVFVAALAESLAIVGVLAPGVLVMLTAGALIADGVIAFWPATGLAVAGAILGDAFSYWLGCRYRFQLRTFWPFNRHPAPLDRGVAFFSRHGSKSILLGRFVGPVRAIVPLVAGMLAMPPRRFLIANVSSALLWAPAYLAPGILFGASLKLASEAATGLVFVALALAAVLGLTGWITRRLVTWASAQSNRWLRTMLAWADVHPIPGRIATALADPDHPDATVLTGLAFTLLAATLALALSIGIALTGPESLTINQWMLDLGHSLNAPGIDSILAALSHFGNPMLLLLLVLAVALFLHHHGRDRDALYWLSAACFALIASTTLGTFIGTTRPPAINSAPWQLSWPWSFPDPEVLGSVLVYGFLALLIGLRLSARWRWIPAALAAGIVSAQGFTALYFGAAWLTDLIASAALGLLWLAAVGLAFSRHSSHSGSAIGLTTVVLAVWVPAWMFLTLTTSQQTLAQYRPTAPTAHILPSQWLAGEPLDLPGNRLGLWSADLQPLDLQYAGSLIALQGALALTGCEPAEILNPGNALQLLLTSAPLRQLPLIAHVHQGQHEALACARDNFEGRRDVVRLWSTKYRVEGLGPLWVGQITRVTKEDIAGLLAIPVTEPVAQTAARARLGQALARQGGCRVTGEEIMRILACPPPHPNAELKSAEPASDRESEQP